MILLFFINISYDFQQKKGPRDPPLIPYYDTNLQIYSRKTDNLQILFKIICVKIYAEFLRKNCVIFFFLFKTFQRAVKSQNPMTGSRFKYRFTQV